MVHHPKLTFLDKLLEAFGASFLICALGIPITFYSKIPSTIPIHFDIAGIPNGVGSKVHLIFAPCLGAVVYIGLFFIKRYSIHMNYPIPVTDENRADLLRLTLQMMRWLRVAIALFFMLLAISMVRIGLGVSDRASIYFLIYFLLALAGIVGFYMYRMIQLHQDSEE